MASDQGYCARLLLDDVPAAIAGARRTLLSLSVENCSGVTWAHQGERAVYLSYRWLDRRGRAELGQGVWTPLPGPVAPGERVAATLQIHPPDQPGRYTLALDLLQAGVAWFGLRQQLPIQCLPASGRPVTLIARNCVPHDAIGDALVRKLRLLESWGYAPLLLAEYVDPRLPAEVRALAIEASCEQLLGPAPGYRWAAEHLRHSALVMLEYPEYYPLLELARQALPGALLFDYHGVTPPELWASSSGREQLRQGREQLELFAQADAAIVHSDYAAAELLASGQIAPERVQIIPFGVEPRWSPGTGLSRPPGLDGDPLLLYVGRMAGNKRIDLLVRMLALVSASYPRAQLALVGDDRAPPYQEHVAQARRLSQKLGVEQQVVFTGVVEDALPYFQACDLYVTSSLHEGFCIPVIEALACGKPVVASAATALPWTVGDAGLLFEPGDAEGFAAQVLRLLRSREEQAGAPSLYQQLQQCALRRAADFSQDRHTSALRTLVERLAGPASPPAASLTSRLRAWLGIDR